MAHCHAPLRKLVLVPSPYAWHPTPAHIAKCHLERHGVPGRKSYDADFKRRIAESMMEKQRLPYKGARAILRSNDAIGMA